MIGLLTWGQGSWRSSWAAVNERLANHPFRHSNSLNAVGKCATDRAYAHNRSATPAGKGIFSSCQGDE